MAQITIASTDTPNTMRTSVNTMMTELYSVKEKRVIEFIHPSSVGSGSTAYIVESIGYAVSGDFRIYFRTAGTLKNLHAWVKGNAAITSVVFTIMRGVGNGASSATAITVTLDPDGNFVYGSDTVNSISISANDWIELRVVNSSSGFAITGIGATVEFIPS